MKALPLHDRLHRARILLEWHPPMHVMPMRSICSGTVISRPLKSVTVDALFVFLVSALLLDWLCSSLLLFCAHPPSVMAPVVIAPAAMSSSINLLLVIFSGVLSILCPFFIVCRLLGARLRRILRLRNGVLLRRNWRACRLSGFLHRRCGLSRCVWRQVRPKAPWAPGRKGRI